MEKVLKCSWRLCVNNRDSWKQRPTAIRLSLCTGTIILCQGLWVRCLRMIYCPPQHCCKKPMNHQRLILLHSRGGSSSRCRLRVETLSPASFSHCRSSPRRAASRKLRSKVKICSSQEKRGRKRGKDGGEARGQNLRESARRRTEQKWQNHSESGREETERTQSRYQLWGKGLIEHAGRDLLREALTRGSKDRSRKVITVVEKESAAATRNQYFTAGCWNGGGNCLPEFPP